MARTMLDLMPVKLSKVIERSPTVREEAAVCLWPVMNLGKSGGKPGEVTVWGCKLYIKVVSFWMRYYPRAGRKLPEAANREVVAPTRGSLTDLVGNGRHRRSAARAGHHRIVWWRPTGVHEYSSHGAIGFWQIRVLSFRAPRSGLAPSCTSAVKSRCSPRVDSDPIHAPET